MWGLNDLVESIWISINRRVCVGKGVLLAPLFRDKLGYLLGQDPLWCVYWLVQNNHIIFAALCVDEEIL
jgi:hypothetical protein